MNVSTDESFNLAKKLLIMVKNAGSKNKCGRLMKNMIPTNSGLIGKIYGTGHKLHN